MSPRRLGHAPFGREGVHRPSLWREERKRLADARMWVSALVGVAPSTRQSADRPIGNASPAPEAAWSQAASVIGMERSRWPGPGAPSRA